jgi:hypothetical protein
VDTRAVGSQCDGHREEAYGLLGLRWFRIFVGDPKVVIEPEVGGVLAEDRFQQREAPRGIELQQGIEDVSEPGAQLPPALRLFAETAQPGRVAPVHQVADGGPI